MGSEQMDREVAAYVRARSSMATLLFTGAEPCPYPGHRDSDWRLPGGRFVCGVCHPPAPGLVLGES